MKDDENIEFIEDKSQDLINHLIKHDSEIKGSIKIDVRQDGGFDIIKHNGSDTEVNKIHNVSKEKLIELLDKRL